jgi:hypothetical protein
MDLIYQFKNVQHVKSIVVEEFYTIKFADFIGANPYCSINEAVAGCPNSRAKSAGVFPFLSLAVGSAPASIRSLMTSSGTLP